MQNAHPIYSLQGTIFGPLNQAFEVIRSRSQAAVEAVALTMPHLGFAALIASKPCRQRDIVLAMVAARIVAPYTKLATARWWHTTTLAEDFEVADASEDELYAAMDWLLQRQSKIENKLASKHLQLGGLVLYDLSSSYFEGSTYPLAKRGYNRDGKRGYLDAPTSTNRTPIEVSKTTGPAKVPARTSLPDWDRSNPAKDEFVAPGYGGYLVRSRDGSVRFSGTLQWGGGLVRP